jgi:hypothetical protein
MDRDYGLDRSRRSATARNDARNRFTTVLQRWKDKKAEVISTHPLPDTDELNAKVPASEWEIGLDGKPQKPWKTVYIIYLVDLQTGALFTYFNSTYGAMLMYTQLEDQVSVMRMLRGAQVLPVVCPEKRPLKTQFGLKSRPHLQIIDWRTPSSGDPKLAPPSSTPQLTGPAQSGSTTPTTAAPASTPATPTASTILDNTKPVKQVTIAEFVADEILWK